MATYYVWSGAGGANSGASWTNAYTAFASAVTAATADGDIIKVHYTHQEEVSVDTTYTFANNVRVISVNKDSSDAVTAMGTGGWLGNSTTNRTVTISGAYKLFFYGITIRVSGSSTDHIQLSYIDGAHGEYESCYFWLGNTGVSSRIMLGLATSASNGFIKCTDCTFRFGATGQSIQLASKSEVFGGSISADGSVPTTLFSQTTSSPAGALYLFHGMDLSSVSGTLAMSSTASAVDFNFIGCKLHASATILASQSITNKSSACAYVYDSSSGDEHYKFAYYDAFGEITVSTAIYANDGATYDGTNYYSWKIVTSANCSYYTPFVTPWIEKYHSATSAITPYLEVLRDGSTTAYQDDEVWAEFTVKTTSGSTLYTLFNDRMALLGTPANQASGVGTSGWTGDAASAWSGKLSATASQTPAEIGTLAARVCVGEPSVTVYVDPKIRT